MSSHTDPVKAYLASIGSRGGSNVTEKRRAANAANARKPRGKRSTKVVVDEAK